jgi:two-component system phosphate regulon sensor histidine kinase PhoR
MSNTIADILTISDLESGSSVQELGEFDFADVVEEASDAISPLSESAEVDIILELESVFVHSDKRRIYELCMNLITNAVKYNKPGGTVSLTLRNDGENAIFTVRDTGIGIAEKYQQRVFERFFRADSGRDKRVGGTGLGLSIVKHIVSIYAGTITLQSKVGEGTTIIVSLPILV